MPPDIFGTLRALAASVDRPEHTSRQRQRGDRVTARRMSLVGQSRLLTVGRATSGLPLEADSFIGRWHVSNAPATEFLPLQAYQSDGGDRGINVELSPKTVRKQRIEQRRLHPHTWIFGDDHLLQAQLPDLQSSIRIPCAHLARRVELSLPS
jgi:hypothetical protein